MGISFTDQYYLQDAIERSDAAGCRDALDKGADPNWAVNLLGGTLLTLAIDRANMDIVRLLIERGASVNAKDKDGYVPLIAAAMNSNLDACHLLVEKGADPLVRTKNGFTVLHWPASKAHLEVCKFLMDLGVDIHAPDSSDMTPLHLAAAAGNAGNVDVCRLLVAAGASSSCMPASPKQDYVTPFQLSVRNGHCPIVVYFLQECGEDPAQRTVAGKTMLQIAANSQVKEVLRSAKIEFSVQRAIDGDGRSPASKAGVGRGVTPL